MRVLAPSVLGAVNPFLEPDFLLAVGGLILVLLAGAIAFYFADRWKRKQLAEDRDFASSLSVYREMMEHGDLSSEEYQRVRAQLAERMKSTGAGLGSAETMSTPKLVDQEDSDQVDDSRGVAGSELPQT